MDKKIGELEYLIEISDENMEKQLGRRRKNWKRIKKLWRREYRTHENACNRVDQKDYLIDLAQPAVSIETQKERFAERFQEIRDSGNGIVQEIGTRIRGGGKAKWAQIAL